ncbi:hypothetical protein BBJ28_00022289 [Nothophytophthora sp. Chile5]|nr:hypothetical protein BBJ28_00022289 [Nothophytophthora sp. Chile5]
MGEMGDAATGEGAMALQLMRAKQNAYYIHAVQDALQAEEQRKQRLQKAASKRESKGLEKQFARERSKDRERLRQIQEDHALLLNAKIAQWKARNGSVALIANAGAAKSTVIKQQSARKSKPQAAKLSKKTLDRLAVPRQAIVDAEDATEDRPSSSAALTSRGHAETSQELAFYKDVYRKQDRQRLFSSSSLPVLNAGTLKTVRPLVTWSLAFLP